MEGAPGANDNASGVAAMLEIARLIKDVPSDTEIRFISFDCEEYGLVGSQHYANQLSDSEIQRIVGVINFDMFASKEIEGMYIGTVDGQPNFISELFDGFALTDKNMSDHISFVSLAIPAVQIGHEAESVNHTPEDTIEQIDVEKLVQGATKGLDAILHFMSDGTASFQQNFQLNTDLVFPMNLFEIDLHHDDLDKTSFETKHGITQSTPIPTKTENWYEIKQTYAAMIDWFRMPQETHFIYNGALDKIVIQMNADETHYAVSFLEDSMVKINNPDDYWQIEAQIQGAAFVDAWKNGDGTCYILTETDQQYELYIFQYRNLTIYGSVQSLENYGSASQLSIWEEKLKPLLEKRNLLDEIVGIHVLIDSYGDDVTLSFIPEGDGYILFISENEIYEEQGRIYAIEDLENQMAIAYEMVLKQ